MEVHYGPTLNCTGRRAEVYRAPSASTRGYESGPGATNARIAGPLRWPLAACLALHLNFVPLRLIALGQRNDEHAIAILGRDFAFVHGRGQRDRSREAAAMPLDAVEGAALLLLFLLLLCLLTLQSKLMQYDQYRFAIPYYQRYFSSHQ